MYTNDDRLTIQIESVSNPRSKTTHIFKRIYELRSMDGGCAVLPEIFIFDLNLL